MKNGTKYIEVRADTLPYTFKESIMKRKAVITHPRGKYKKQFRFVLVGDNSEPLGQSEFYKNREDLMKTLKKYFKDFEIEDKTLIK